MKNIFFYFIRFLLSRIANSIIGFFGYIIIFRCGSAIGDHVYMSGILREINITKKNKIILFSNYYELFENNIRVNTLCRFKQESYIWFFLSCIKGKNIYEFRSIHIKENMKFHFLKSHKNNQMPIAEAMSEHFNLKLDYSNLKNEIYFSENELLQFEKKFQLPKNYALIQSVTKKTFTTCKDWRVSGMQKIVDSFQGVNWFQIGTSNEPKLKNCKYLFDLELKELAFIIYKSNFLVCYEGLFNHLASCFDKKNFLIHTGFLHSNSINYQNNILIEENLKMPCYPCFNLNCENHNEDFVNLIDENKVIDIIRNNIQ